MITALCILVCGVVSKSLILINETYRIYVFRISILNIDDPFAVLVLVLETQVLDNNTEGCMTT